MTMNITEKDKTLNEIINWCEQLEAEGLRLASALLIQHDKAAYSVVKGQVNAYENTADHCRSLLNSSDPTPTETPNQNNRTDTLHTLKLKAETQPTFDLTETNQ